jgi:hypothetical protein
MNSFTHFLKKEKNNIFLVVVFFSLFILFLVISSISEGTLGGADDISHFKISKYSWKYPSLLLDHWGKPVFTLLSSPFAQFGYTGMRVFNIIAGLLTAFLCFRICRFADFKSPGLVVIFVCFTPVYFMLLLTGMTEILFSLVLVTALYFVIKKRFIFSAIVLSFLPFVRNEGVVIFPVFIILYTLRYKFKAIPFLLTGVVIYSIVGYFYYHDFFWLANNLPYQGENIYGHGQILHFIKATKVILGIPLAVLFVLGLFIVSFRFFAGDFRNETVQIEFLLILGAFISYYVAHTYVWWKGIGNSLGLERVIAGVCPLACIIAVKGSDFVVERILRFKWLKITGYIGLLYFIISTPFKVYQVPVPLNDNQQLIKVAAKWLSESSYKNNKIFYYDPYVFFYLGVDPYDNSQTQEKVNNPAKPEENIPDGSIVVWDAHFGPNEGRLPIENLQNNTHFLLLNKFAPKEPYKVLGGYDYEIYIFQKVSK